MIEEIVIGVLPKLFKKVAGEYFKPGFEENDIINRANQAFEKSCELFFEKYGKMFGAPDESFLARQANIETLIRKVFSGSGDLCGGDLYPAGFDGAPDVSPQALDFLPP
jgi:hypothetical protein